MNLQKNINIELKRLNSTNETVKYRVLNKVRTEFQKIITKDCIGSISDSKMIELLKNMINQRKYYINLYKKAGRNDLADEMLLENQELLAFLPDEISETEIYKTVKILMSSSPGDASRNRIMGILMNHYQGKNIDGSKASEIVNNILTEVH